MPAELREPEAAPSAAARARVAGRVVEPVAPVVMPRMVPLSMMVTGNGLPGTVQTMRQGAGCLLVTRSRPAGPGRG